MIQSATGTVKRSTKYTGMPMAHVKNRLKICASEERVDQQVLACEKELQHEAKRTASGTTRASIYFLELTFRAK